MDFTLSDEQQLIRQTAREFCDAEIAPHAADWDRTETIDREIVGEVVRAVDQVTSLVGAGVSTLEQVQSTARRVASDVVLPQMASAAGLLAVIREGLTWFRPGGDGKHGHHRRP